MKIILEHDVKYLGEEGDVKTVANGYARNYLFPRQMAVPYNGATVAYFEGRKGEIEDRKKAKRNDASSIKERLEAETITFALSAGPTGKLYGAVTGSTVAEELAKKGFEIERKRIEVPGLTIKHVGKYTVTVRLYENTTAGVTVVVEAQAPEPSPSAPTPRPRRPRYSDREREREREENAEDAFSRPEEPPVTEAVAEVAEVSAVG
jgi:large subunit ribosomal protein L9